jgi:hypothetical protein
MPSLSGFVVSGLNWIQVGAWLWSTWKMELKRPVAADALTAPRLFLADFSISTAVNSTRHSHHGKVSYSMLLPSSRSIGIRAASLTRSHVTGSFQNQMRAASKKATDNLTPSTDAGIHSGVAAPKAFPKDVPDFNAVTDYRTSYVLEIRKELKTVLTCFAQQLFPHPHKCT